MKKLSGFVCFIGILTIFMLLFSSLQAATQERDLEEIERETRRISKHIINQGVQEEAVLIIGDTGEGKSCLLNYLAGREFVAQEEMESFGEIVLHCRNPLTSIAEGIVSRTMIPICWNFYWDCPGFDDSRGAVQDIINAFTLSALIKNSRRIKFLVAVSENTLREVRKQKFLALLRHLGSFVDNTDDLIRGLCLVVTRNKELNLTGVRDGMASMLQEARSNIILGDSQRKILRHLSSLSSRIAFFKAPVQAGDIDKKERNAMGNTIEIELKKAEYVEQPKVNVSISDKSKLYIPDLARQFNASLVSFVSDKFYAGVGEFLYHSIDNHRGSVRELRSDFERFSDQLNEISSKSKNFEARLNAFKAVANRFPRDKLLQDIQHLEFWFKFLRNFRGIVDLAVTDKDEWYRLTIATAREDVHALTASPEREVRGSTLSLKGLLVGMQDLSQALNEVDRKRGEFSELTIYSLNTLFVDADIERTGTNLVLISPRIRVIEQRRINLKGRDREARANLEGKDEEARAKNGEPGLPGLPGMSGGRLYARAVHFSDLSNLIVDVSGGTGGGGQDGKEGTPGMKGGDGGLMDVMARKKIKQRKNAFAGIRADASIWEKRERLGKFFFTFNDKFEETYQSYEPGRPGGEGGKGGAGGKGGKSGQIVLLDDSAVDPLSRIQKIDREGGKGSDGKAGKAGIDGKKGLTYEGIYINEIPFSKAIRVAKEKSLSPLRGTGTVMLIGFAAGGQNIVRILRATAGILPANGIEIRGIRIPAQVLGQLATIGADIVDRMVVALTPYAGDRLAGAGVVSASQATLSVVSSAASRGWKVGPDSISDGTTSPSLTPSVPANGGIPVFNDVGIEEPAGAVLIDGDTKHRTYIDFESQLKKRDPHKKFIKEFNRIRSAL